MAKKETNDGRETYDMCEALQGLLEDSRIEGWNNGNEAGIKDGIKQGQSMLNSLNAKLIKDNRIDEMMRAVTDPDYQMQLLREYGLIAEQE